MLTKKFFLVSLFKVFVFRPKPFLGMFFGEIFRGHFFFVARPVAAVASHFKAAK